MEAPSEFQIVHCDAVAFHLPIGRPDAEHEIEEPPQRQAGLPHLAHTRVDLAVEDMASLGNVALEGSDVLCLLGGSRQQAFFAGIRAQRGRRILAN